MVIGVGRGVPLIMDWKKAYLSSNCRAYFHPTIFRKVAYAYTSSALHGHV